RLAPDHPGPAGGGLMGRQPSSWSPWRAARQIRTVPAGVTPAAKTAAGVTARSVTVALPAPGRTWPELRSRASTVHASGREPACPAATQPAPRTRTACTAPGRVFAREGSRVQRLPSAECHSVAISLVGSPGAGVAVVPPRSTPPAPSATVRAYDWVSGPASK